MDFEWDTDVLDFQSEVFFLRSIRRNGRLLCEVIMKGSKEECRGLKTYVSLLDAKSEQVMVTTIFPPRPLDVKNEEGLASLSPSRHFLRRGSLRLEEKTVISLGWKLPNHI